MSYFETLEAKIGHMESKGKAVHIDVIALLAVTEQLKRIADMMEASAPQSHGDTTIVSLANDWPEPWKVDKLTGEPMHKCSKQATHAYLTWEDCNVCEDNESCSDRVPF